MTVTAFDLEQRTVTGVLMPLHGVAHKRGVNWRFARESVELAEGAPLNLYHNREQRIGAAVHAENTDAGLVATFAIDPGPAGDEALQDAAAGLLSFSIEISDPEFRDAGGARMVTKAKAEEVALTPVPAFSGAGVTSVKFDGLPDTDPAPAPAVQFDAEALGAALARHLGPAREVVSAGGGALQVAEAAPYRFDGLRGQYDFSTDLVAASRGDGEAMQRATLFVREQFDVTQANTAALSPTQNRPDLYVDQREFLYPLWSAVNRGSLTDNTPFTFPKFNTSSGLVANHTEGTEPTEGAFSATSQTITPTPVSGKVEISREVWDQGGNPQVSALLWTQMQRAWYEALEAQVVTTLTAAAASITDIALPTGAEDGVLDDAIVDAFTALQYVRGGFSFDQFAVQVDLYRRLAAASDTTGRRLFPMLAPQNAGGGAASRFSSMDVYGVRAYPSWALAPTGTAVANSWLFDSMSVHGWASVPQRLQFEYRVSLVDLAIWGYKAVAVSDVNGVRQVTYDPVV